MGNLANALTETDAKASFDSWLEGLALARKLGQRGAVIAGTGNLGYCAFLAGEWDVALAEMDVWLAEELAPSNRLVMLNNALIIRASRGESIDEGLAELRRVGADMTGAWDLFVDDPQANGALVNGELKTARDSFAHIAEVDPGLGSEYLYRAGRPALWAGDLADAKDLTRRQEETGAYGPVAEARLTTLRAGIAALEGRTKEALALYREALAGWRNSHSVWDEALTGVDMALLLDPAEREVAEVAAATRQILERLRARPYLERLEAASSQTAPRKPADVPKRSLEEAVTG
jgi:tetratricopeptide (TPR) repeat protein